MFSGGSKGNIRKKRINTDWKLKFKFESSAF